jgi:putative ABC transport system permease protein
MFLSGFGTINAMKGQLGNQMATIFFRKSLVVFQFVITIVMIVGSLYHLPAAPLRHEQRPWL